MYIKQEKSVHSYTTYIDYESGKKNNVIVQQQPSHRLSRKEKEINLLLVNKDVSGGWGDGVKNLNGGYMEQ